MSKYYVMLLGCLSLLVATAVQANMTASDVSHQVDHALPQTTHTTPAVFQSQAPHHPQKVMAKNPWALVLFFESSCPHCQRFTPILKAYSDQHELHVYAFTLDGKGLPAYPNPIPATPKIRQAFFGTQPIMTPTVFLVNVNTMDAMEVAQGELSETALAHRVQTLLQRAKGFSRGKSHERH